MGVSLVLACSAKYEHHIAPFMAAVAQLERQPDEVVLVTDSVKPNFDCTRVGNMREWNLGDWYNHGFDAATQDWVVWTGADDRLRPHALNTIDASLADAIPFGLQYTTGQVWIPGNVTAQTILEVRENLVPCGSPVRRRMWELQPFEPSFYPLDDWAFWVGISAHGARFQPTLSIDVDYDYGPGHINPPTEPTRSHIAEWAKGLQ